MQKNLLLPGAKSAILLDQPHRPFSPWWRRTALAVGALTVLVGGVDVLTRFAENFEGDNVAFTAFAPAVLLLNPSLQAEVQGATTAPFVPVRVVIASIGVNAKVEQVGKTAAGAMATPKALANLGWYSLGAKPGSAGNAVFAGHVNNSLGFPGVFKKLSEIKKGDTFDVVGEEGERLTYRVETITSYQEEEAPLEEIFTKTGPSNVILITCEGAWDEATHTFDKRLVVVAEPLWP